MRVGICRYGLPLQTDAESTVGGGFLTRAVLDAVEAGGHTPVLMGSVAKGVSTPYEKRNHGVDAMLILTGPHNPLYSGAFDVYGLLARHEGPVAYLQWDNALPFHFGALNSPKAQAKAGVGPNSIFRNKRWYIMAQTREATLRSSGGAAVGYKTAPWTYVPCLFELAELEKTPWKPMGDPVYRKLGYFGSDRPGRMKEILRWFADPAAPAVGLHGKWSDKSLLQISQRQGLASTLSYNGTVAEREVTRTLNRYAATMYLADPLYVKEDFIAQRFFENVIAGVPVVYSDKVQPSVQAVIEPEWQVKDVVELYAWVARVNDLSPRKRALLVEAQAHAVRKFAAGRNDTIQRAIKDVLR